MRTATTRTNRFVFASLGCLLALLLVIGAGCGKQENPPATPEPNAASGSQTPVPNDVPSPVVAPSVPEPNAVAATVNGEVITEAQVEAQVDGYLRSNQQAAMMPPDLMNQIRPMLRTRMLDALIGQVLLLQEAKKSGVTVSDDEVMTELEERAAGQTPPLTVDQLKMMFAAQGVDFADVVADFRNALTLDKFLTEKMADQAEVSEEEARAYYNDNITDFNQPERVEASHILLGFGLTDPNADPSTDPNRILAEELLAQIRDGADFGELAMANSVDKTSSVKGGELGYFWRERMVPEFSDAAFALEPNEVSDVVESQYGYHIIKVTDHKDAGIAPFEEAQTYIENLLKEQKQTELVTAYLTELKAGATIEYPAADEPEASAPTPSTTTPAPIIRTPRPAEPGAGESDVTVIEPNTN